MFLPVVQAGFGLYPSGNGREAKRQDKTWTTAEQVKESKTMSLIFSLLDMQRTGPELSCSNKMPAQGEWFSSEPWKLLTVVGAISVQLCFIFLEKLHWNQRSKVLCPNLVGKKMPETMEGLLQNFPSVHRCSSQLNRPGFRRDTDRYAARNELCPWKQQSSNSWETPAVHREN